MNLSPLKRFLAIFWGTIVIFLLGYTDLALPKVAIASDYITCIYPAAKLIATGRMADLYPPLETNTFSDAPYDQFAHALLTDLPETITAWYAYTPIVAAAFFPLSYFPANISLLFWQIISIAALFASITVLNKHEIKNAFWLALSFLPLTITLWIGQLGIVFGLAVLSLGLHFIQKQRFLIAGLIWSICLLKPQYFVVPLFISLFYALQKKFNCLFGLVIGALVLSSIVFLICPSSILAQWLHVFQISDAVYANPNSGVPQHLVISLSRIILLHSSIEQHTSIKLLTYGISALFFGIALFVCHRLAKSNLNKNLILVASIIVSLLLMPLVLPYLFYYDLSIFYFGFLAFLTLKEEEKSSLNLSIRIVFWSTFIYALVFLTAKTFAEPILLIAVFIFVYIQLLIKLNKLAKADDV